MTGMLQWLLLAWGLALEESSHLSRLLGLFLVCMDLTWMKSISQQSLWPEGPLLGLS